MTLGIEREGLAEPLRAFAASGTPVLGTCAGLIMLDREHLGLHGHRWRERNAFGRQVRSFEADLDIPGIDGAPVRAVFIRAPWIAEHGAGVEILAAVDGHPVAARAGQPARRSRSTRSSATTTPARAFLAQVRAARNGAG